MDPFAPSILRSKVRIPASTLNIFNIILNCHGKRIKINNRGRDWCIFKNRLGREIERFYVFKIVFTFLFYRSVQSVSQSVCQSVSQSVSWLHFKVEHKTILGSSFLIAHRLISLPAWSESVNHQLKIPTHAPWFFVPGVGRYQCDQIWRNFATLALF